MKNLNLISLYDQVELGETEMVSLNDQLLLSVKGGLKADWNGICPTFNSGCGKKKKKVAV